MANAAQIPTCLTPEQTGDQSVDEDYLYVFWTSGVELRCEPVGDVYSKDLAQRWIQNVKYGKSFPLTATEQCMLQILGEQEVDNADLIKAWNKNAGETPPTTASSVPAIPQLEIRRSDSLPAPEGAPKAYSPRPATQRPAPIISEERSPPQRVFTSKFNRQAVLFDKLMRYSNV